MSFRLLKLPSIYAYAVYQITENIVSEFIELHTKLTFQLNLETSNRRLPESCQNLGTRYAGILLPFTAFITDGCCKTFLLIPS